MPLALCEVVVQHDVLFGPPLRSPFTVHASPRSPEPGPTGRWEWLVPDPPKRTPPPALCDPEPEPVTRPSQLRVGSGKTLTGGKRGNGGTSRTPYGFLRGLGGVLKGGKKKPGGKKPPGKKPGGFSP